MTMREKKFMSESEMIRLVTELNPDVIDETGDLLGPVWDGDIDPDWVRIGWERGNLQVTTVTKNGLPWYRYVWHRNNNNFLNVNASVYVGPKNGSDKWLWLIGADYIARENNCRGIAMVSRRKGHIEQCARGMFKVRGVYMTRDLDGLADHFPKDIKIKVTNAT